LAGIKFGDFVQNDIFQIGEFGNLVPQPNKDVTTMIYALWQFAI